MRRLAIVTTHPIQYYAPWFRHLAARSGLELKVWYLWDFGVRECEDKGFRQTILLIRWVKVNGKKSYAADGTI